MLARTVFENPSAKFPRQGPTGRFAWIQAVSGVLRATNSVRVGENGRFRPVF